MQNIPVEYIIEPEPIKTSYQYETSSISLLQCQVLRYRRRLQWSTIHSATQRSCFLFDNFSTPVKGYRQKEKEEEKEEEEEKEKEKKLL